MDKLNSWKTKKLPESKAERLAVSLAKRRITNMICSGKAAKKMMKKMKLVLTNDSPKSLEEIAQRANEIVAVEFSEYGRPSGSTSGKKVAHKQESEEDTETPIQEEEAPKKRGKREKKEEEETTDKGVPEEDTESEDDEDKEPTDDELAVEEA